MTILLCCKWEAINGKLYPYKTYNWHHERVILFNQKNNISFYSFILIVRDKRRLLPNYFTMSRKFT